MSPGAGISPLPAASRADLDFTKLSIHVWSAEAIFFLFFISLWVVAHGYIEYATLPTLVRWSAWQVWLGGPHQARWLITTHTNWHCASWGGNPYNIKKWPSGLTVRSPKLTVQSPKLRGGPGSPTPYSRRLPDAMWSVWPNAFITMFCYVLLANTLTQAVKPIALVTEAILWYKLFDMLKHRFVK